MPTIYRLTIRPKRKPVATAARVIEPETDKALGPDLPTLLKADLVAMAEAKGLDASGTKAELIERLSDG